MTAQTSLSKDILESVANQIGERLTHVGQQAISQGRTLTLAESMPVWRLGLDATASTDHAIGTIAQPTGYWHHQIRHDGLSNEYARSRPKGPAAKDWQLEEIVTSPIAEKIDNAIKWVDAHIKGEGEVRLLVVPSYFIHALWVIVTDVDSIIIADMPKGSTGLQYNRAYNSNDFLKALAAGAHILGMPPQ